jgi:hypothetical protein
VPAAAPFGGWCGCCERRGSLWIGNRRLGHHCLAWGPCDPVLACWSINIERDTM